MPAAVAVPLIAGAASAGAQIVSSKIASNAAKNAAKTQSNAANVAMANTRQDTDRALGYIDSMRGNIRPPSQMGGAYGSLSSMMGLGGGPQAQPAMPRAGMPGAGLFSGQPQMVRMQAPTGEVQHVPADRAAFYEAKGARRLQ